MWSFIGPLVRENDDKASAFRNVERHNGLEAWRVLAEPINEDKAIMRKHLLPLVNNPKAAKSLNEVEDRLRDWSTNCRLLVENGGQMPDDYTRRNVFVGMLPPELNTYITMRMEEPAFDTYAKIKQHVVKYVKVQQNQTKNTATAPGRDLAGDAPERS